MSAVGRQQQRGRIVGWAGLALALFIAVAAVRVAPYAWTWCAFLAVGALVMAYAALRRLGVVRFDIRNPRR